MIDLINKLCNVESTTGDETNISELAHKELSKFCDATVDGHGNVIGSLGANNTNFHIMLDAHIDQVGFIVTCITEKGFIKFSSCGGIDKRFLPGMLVKILGKETITGIIGCVPPHLTSGDIKKISSIDELFIDTGMLVEEVKRIVSIGDRIAFYGSPERMLNGRLVSKSLDNRAGVAAVIKSMELISKLRLCIKVSAVLSVQEEVNALGAKVLSYRLNPDEAIVVDTTFGGQPNVNSEKTGELGKGFMIGVSPILDRNIGEEIVSLAKANKLAYQFEVMGERTGTNADSISIAKSGVKTALISIPIRYMHTPNEVADICDIENTAEILFHYISRINDIKERGMCGG